VNTTYEKSKPWNEQVIWKVKKFTNNSMCIKEWTQLCKFVAMCIVHLEACTLTNENGFSREKFFEWKWVWGKGLELQNQRQLGQRSSDLGGNDLPQIL